MSNLYFGLDKSTLQEKEVDVEEFLGINKLDELAADNRKESFEYDLKVHGKSFHCDMRIKEITMKMKSNTIDEEFEVEEE